jgi:hypothetical protein
MRVNRKRNEEKLFLRLYMKKDKDLQILKLKVVILSLLSLTLTLFSNGDLLSQKVQQGLSTKFTDVILGGLKPGMVYSLKKEQGLPYKVMNKAERKYPLEIKVEIPRKEELREGYEPIPDPGWIKVMPERFDLASGEESDCDVIISIPQDKEYENRNFQAFLVTETVMSPDSPGLYVGLGLKSRLRFSTGPTPQQTFEEHRRRTLEALKIELAPFNLYLSNVPVGKEIELGKNIYPTLQVINRGDETYQFELAVADNPDSYGLSAGYEPAPDKSWLKLSKKSIKTKKRQIQDIAMKLKIPSSEEYKNKNFAFVITAEIKNLDVPVRIYSRIYVKTQK